MYTSIPRALIEVLLLIGVSAGIGIAIGRAFGNRGVVEEIVATEDSKEVPLVGIDDLKLLHGVDAAIEQVLLKNEVDSFDALSRTTPAKLKKILESGGSQFFAIDTTSWPHQAALANQDRWMELKKFKLKLAKRRI